MPALKDIEYKEINGIKVLEETFNFGDSKSIPQNIVGIYCIFNSKYCYIGQSLDISQRTRHHYNSCNSNRHCNEYLQRVYKKYPEDPFFVKILEIINDRSSLLIREKYWIDFYKNNTDLICTNIADPVVVYSHCENNHRKTVYQFDANGLLLNKWKGIADASRNTNVSKALISACVRNKAKHGGGYIWSYHANINIEDYDPIRASIPVIQYDLDGNFIKEWPSLTNAANALSCETNCISMCCYHKIASAKNYIWRHVGDAVSEEDVIKAKERAETRCCAYDLDGNFIKMFDTCKIAASELGVTLRNLYDCCNRKLHRVKNYIFRYEGDGITIDDLWQLSRANGKPVLQIKDGSVIGEFESAVEAGKELGISGNNVRGSCTNNKPYKGYTWRYMTMEEWLKYKNICQH